MYVGKTLLSLYITLCLTRRSSRDRIKQSFSEAELLAEFVQLDRQNQLAVVYIANETTMIAYDTLFNSLANSYTRTTFFLVDPSEFSTTGQFKVEDDFAKPLIYLRRYGFTKDSFEIPDENKLKSIVAKRQDMNRKQFINADAQVFTADRSWRWDKEIDVSLENEYGGHFGNGFQHPTSADELSKIFKVADRYGDIPCVMYIVKAGNEHDPMAEKLASKFISTFFIKITSDTYASVTGISPYSGLPEPSFKVYRFGQLTQHFSFTRKRDLENKIAYYTNMNKPNYLKTIKDEGEKILRNR